MRVRIRQSRRRGRWIVAGVIAVAAGVAVWAVARWWPADQRPGWTGTQQAAAVAEIVGAGAGVLGLAVAILAYLRPRPAHPGKPAGRQGMQVVGQVPQPAAWFQPREAGQRLAQAAGRGRTAVPAQVITGMGGVGKTQLAADFARGLADRGKLDLLVWITAASPDAIVAGYAEAAAVLGLAEAGGDAQRAAQRFLVWAEHTDQRWLVVLDDLARPGDLAGWWPPLGRPRGRVLVTTRRRDAVLQADGRVLVDVDLFTEAEARSYLGQALPGHRSRVLDPLATDLGYLPLALAQAAAYIRDRGLTCEQYRARLADRRRRLHDLLPEQQALPDEQQATVAAAWSLSVEAADELKPAGVGRPVLEIASVLDPNGCPAAVFTTQALLEYLAAVTGRQVTAENVGDALHNLHRLSLLTIDDDRAGVRVHALVQRATRDSLTDQQTGRIARAAADALLERWPDPEPDAAASASMRANTAAVYEHTGDALLTPLPHPVLSRAGWSLGRTGRVGAGRDYFQRLHDHVVRVLGPDHVATLETRADLAAWLGEAGDVTGAVAATEEVLAYLVRMLGPDDPSTLAARNNLAGWRGHAGNAAGAAAAYQELLADQLRVLGPDHPDTLSSRGFLASWRGKAGDAAGAAAATEEVLADQLRLLGPDHPHTLGTRAELAVWRGEAGDASGAVAALQELLADLLRVLGPDHPSTLAARNNLAVWRGKAGDAAGAAAATEELLADQLRVLGPDHPHTLSTRGNLAAWRGQAGDAARAAAASEELLADLLRVLGPDHPHTLSTRHNLAAWRGETGDAAGAAAAFQEVLADLQRVLGPDHPDTLTARDNLAEWRDAASGPS